MAGDYITDFYRGNPMKLKLFFVLLIIVLSFLQSCAWQKDDFVDAYNESVTERSIEPYTSESITEPAGERVEMVFDPYADYDYRSLYFDPTDVYCYDGLTDAQRAAYLMLAYAVDCIAAGDISDVTTWRLESDFIIVKDDVDTARELFCANYYVLKDVVDSIEADSKIFKKQTLFTYIASEDGQRDIELYLYCLDKADEILEKLDMTASQKEIAYEIAKYISESGEYDAEYASGNAVYGMLADKKGICESFAYTYDFLCKKAGLNTVASTVTRGDFYHVWCLINIDGEWYNVDPTWMTTMNDGGDYFLFDDTLRYRYQRATSAHTCYYFDHTENKAVYAPECTDASENEQ